MRPTRNQRRFKRAKHTRPTVETDGDSNPLTIQTASLTDVQDILRLQRLNSNELGFLPTTAIRQHVQRGWCITARFRGRVVGYILGWHRMRYAPWCRPVTQLVVAEECRRCTLATILLSAYGDLARRAGQTALQAWTRSDITPAHSLWRALKWTPIAIRTPKTISIVGGTERHRARAKPAILYRLSLTAIRSPHFHDVPTRGGANAATIVATAIRPPRESGRKFA